jgi:hypothetical protein
VSAWLPRGRLEWSAAAVGVAVLCVLGWLVSEAPLQGMLSYLFAFVFFTGLSVGSLALVMVHALTGGMWGEALRPQWMAAARTLPLQLVFALPILTQIPVLYPWDRTAALAGDAQLRAQGWYLNAPFFVARTIGYFVLWLGFLLLVARAGRRRAPGNPRQQDSLPGIASAGLIVFALSMLFASTDWVMSLVPHWHSSMFGMMVSTGCMLGAASLAILHLTSSQAAAPPRLLGDFGSLLLMFVLAWWYLAFMQYLTIWTADLPAETVWYIPRTLTSWRAVAWLGIVTNFALPFAVLLLRSAKRHRWVLASVAAALLLGNLGDALWLVVPSFRPQGLDLRWSDLLAPVGMGALWLCFYLGQYRVQRLPGHAFLTDPALESLGG